MAWDTIGNVNTDAESIKTALQTWESNTAPSSIDEWEIVPTGARCTIVIQYTS